VSPRTFLPVRPRFSTVLCKFSQIFFLRVSPPEGCHPGRFNPPPSDATVDRDASDSDSAIINSVVSHAATSLMHTLLHKTCVFFPIKLLFNRYQRSRSSATKLITYRVHRKSITHIHSSYLQQFLIIVLQFFCADRQTVPATGTLTHKQTPVKSIAASHNRAGAHVINHL